MKDVVKKSFSGKVRDIYDFGDKLVLVTTDRISAFDSILPCIIKGKGIVLNQMSNFWLDFTRELIPNHMISADIMDMPQQFWKPEFEGRCMLVKKLNMLKIESIVRGYITGSGWESYKKNGTVCGIQLPPNLKESQLLIKPIYTPTTKADEGHDEAITFEQTVELLGENLATQVRDISIELYLICSSYAEKKGILIADTKFEFGVDENGILYLADEVLTPDSSRFWSFDDYVVGQGQKSFDKQYLRDWLKKQPGFNDNVIPKRIPKSVRSHTSEKYIEAYERITGLKYRY